MYMQHLVRHVFQNSLGFLLINDHMAAGFQGGFRD